MKLQTAMHLLYKKFVLKIPFFYGGKKYGTYIFMEGEIFILRTPDGIKSHINKKTAKKILKKSREIIIDLSYPLAITLPSNFGYSKWN